MKVRSKLLAMATAFVMLSAMLPPGITADATTVSMADEVIIGPVYLEDNEYVLEGDLVESHSGKPPEDADYAYFKDGVLYLKDFDLSANLENQVDSDTIIVCNIGIWQCIPGLLINDFPLMIHLTGENTISDTSSEYSIYTHRTSSITFTGDGTLKANRPIAAAGGLTIDSGNISITAATQSDSTPIISTSTFQMNGGELSLRGVNCDGLHCDSFSMNSGNFDITVKEENNVTRSGLLSTGFASFTGGTTSIRSDGYAIDCSTLDISNNVEHMQFISTAPEEADDVYKAVNASFVSLTTENLATIVSDYADGSEAVDLPLGSTNLGSYDYVEIMEAEPFTGSVSGVKGNTLTTVRLYLDSSDTPVKTTTVTGNGTYAFSITEEGRYTIKATAPGYLPFVKTVNFINVSSANVAIEMEEFVINFSALYPTPTASELTAGFTNLGTADLGSDDTDIDFGVYAEKLTQTAIDEGWTITREMTVICDGLEVYKKTYEPNDVSMWNLKDNIDQGGAYTIKMRIYAQNGDEIIEKTHTYQLVINGSNIDTVNIVDVETPILGKAPSIAATMMTTGAYVSDVDWCYFNETEDDEAFQWPLMQEGDVFEAGERYQVLIEFRTEEGYSFTETSDGMTAYINGMEATVVWNPYATNKAYVELEFTPLEMGDINADGKFNVADVVALQKWLLCAKDAEKSIVEWKAGNFVDDDRLDAFDLSLMKRALLAQ